MFCTVHPDEGRVVRCLGCLKGVCPQCAFTVENGQVCGAECALTALRASLKKEKSIIRKPSNNRRAYYAYLLITFLIIIMISAYFYSQWTEMMGKIR